MERQLIISIGREFGSGGHVIAEKLAKRFQLPLYDNQMLGCGSEEDPESMAHRQFYRLKKMAEEGESFVIVGRCSEEILKGCRGMISIFILGDYVCKLKRIMEKYELTEEQARQLLPREDSRRKSYHNNFTKGKWGDSRNYDLSINSSKLGIEKTVDLLERYIKERASL